MMKNKVLIKLYVSYLDETYELFIPTNETIKKVVDLIVKSVYELSDSVLDLAIHYNVMDPYTSQIYNETLIVRDTNIVNGKKIVLV